MSIDKINKQVEQTPLSKEDSKAQFVAMTEELGIKHSFNFEEAWEIGEEMRQRKAFRESIVDFETTVREKGGWLSEKETHELNPVKHSFADGCYIREIFNPAGELLVTKIHKKKHPFFLMKGKMSILTESGVQHLEGPHHGITEPGTKRIIYTHTDCVFITVHATDKTNVEEIEQEVIAENFEDPLITVSDINKLKQNI